MKWYLFVGVMFILIMIIDIMRFIDLSSIEIFSDIMDHLVIAQFAFHIYELKKNLKNK